MPIGRDGNPVGGQPAVVTPRGLPGVQIDNTLNAPPAMRGGIPSADAPAATGRQAASAAVGDGPASCRRADRGRRRGAGCSSSQGPGSQGSEGSPQHRHGVPRLHRRRGSGYVAVLSSQKDRAAALRIYADLAQKYPDQLGSRQPEVQEATVADKGVFQRLGRGPPSSQQSAKELCTQLKAAGYASDCWVKQY